MPDHPKRRNSLIARPGSGISLEIELNKLREETHTGDHYLTPAQLEVIYRTNVKTGLTEELAEELFELHGPNELVELSGTSYWKIFRHNLFGWFQCVLWIGAALNFIAYFIARSVSTEETSNEHIYLGVVICLTVICTGLFGFYQEAKNAHMMSGFEKMVPPNAVVIRDGIKKVVPSTNVVVGDIVEMAGGDIVPADVRILSCTNFQTDMSSLTGESTPIKHTVHCTDHNPIESKNMAFFSCSIVQGTARGLVVSVGEMTQIGRIAGLVTGLEKEETPIAKEITHFIKILCAISFAFGILFFIMVYVVNKSILSGFMYMLGIILANVPEGLIVTLTICMTLSANRLKEKNCLAKTLQAVETLGSTSCICTDKTGTLTENRMSVSHLFCNWNVIDKIDWSHVTEKSYGALCLAASLCLKADFSHDTIHLSIHKRKIIGDASESAILRYMETHRNATVVRLEHPKVCEIPFSSEYKYQVSIHRLPNEQGFYLVMKGAPDVVIDFCTKISTEEEDKPMSSADRRNLKTQFTNFGNKGERVLGYCDLLLPVDKFPADYVFDSQEKNFPLSDLRFVGLISLIDPPREGIQDSITLCKQAGIKVVMVTGDHPVTALAISRQVGTISKDSVTAYDYAFDHNIEIADVPAHVKDRFSAAVISGEELRLMCAETLKGVIKRYPELTFARTSPQQKLFIVETFQHLGYVVAVTGDGVNDSPALRKADIGIAMGITGTEVSKQAADMILLDDNFSSIVMGVEEGRRIFDNLKKTIAYTLTSNTPEMMPFVLYAIIGIPLPLTIILILVINVGTDILPAMSLAYETSEMDIMNIPPRNPNDHLVNKALIYMAYFQVGMIQFFAGLYAYLVTMAEGGFNPSKLLGIRNDWDGHNKTVTDSFQIDWSYDERKVLERKAQTAYFFAICLTQVTDVIICKTRRISLIKKGMHNHVLNLSILVNILAALAVIFTPFFNTVLGTYPLEWHSFMLGLPFGVLMIAGDEIRRYLIRNNKSQWLEDETYY